MDAEFQLRARLCETALAFADLCSNRAEVQEGHLVPALTCKWTAKASDRAKLANCIALALENSFLYSLVMSPKTGLGLEGPSRSFRLHVSWYHNPRTV